MTSIRIILADDHQIVLDGLRSLLAGVEGFEIVAEADNGRLLIDYVKALQPDIALVDIDMPVLDGMNALKQLRQEGISTRVIILTMHNESGVIRKAKESGADGFLLKTSDAAELEQAIRAVHAGESHFELDMTTSEGGTSTGSTETEDDEDPRQVLSQREIEVLRLVARGLSNKAIGDALFISPRTVDTHRTNIMRKLDIHHVAGLIRWAMRHNLA